jgi:hypothetical protein
MFGSDPAALNFKAAGWFVMLAAELAAGRGCWQPALPQHGLHVLLALDSPLNCDNRQHLACKVPVGLASPLNC